MKIWMKSALSIVVGSMLLVACGEEKTSTDTSGMVSEIKVDALLNLRPNLDNYDTSTGFFDDIIYGNADAPVTIVEYASLTCNHCATFHTAILPRVKEAFLDTGQAKLVFRNHVRDPYDIAAAAVARCADEPTAKRLISLFFEKQRDWYAQNVNPTEELANIARRIGMSQAKFERCAINTDMRNFLVDFSDLTAKELLLNVTPSVYIDGKLIADYRFETIEAAIKAAQ